jgi:hypothetical protein
MEIYGSISNWNPYKFGFDSLNDLEKLLTATTKRQQAVPTSNARLHFTDERAQGVDGFEHAMRIRQAIEAMRPMVVESEIEVSTPASATSASNLNLDTSATATTMQSTEEINATSTPNSISTTAPEATGSTAQPTVSGSYDGSSGTGTLTFQVTQSGTHGVDDLQFTVYDSDNNPVDQVNIAAGDPMDQAYTLSNGLVLSLGEGEVLQNDTFTVDVEAPAQTPITTFDPQFTQSATEITIGGEYDGSNGTGPLTFDVTRGGIHGTDQIWVAVSDGNNNPIETIKISKKDAIDQQYALTNGLTVTFGAGEIVKDDHFTLDLYTSAEPVPIESFEPAYSGSNAAVTLGGTYDGSNGSDTLTLQVTQGGTHGADDLQISVLDSNSNQIDQLTIAGADPIDQTYTLSNGITLTVDPGKLLQGTTFSVDVSEGEPIAADPDKSFNGVGVDDPNLETGLTVTNGSFQINGVDIAVQEDDTINTVLDRINQSEAGVTAAFDAATETIRLTHNTPGPASDIILENDTSGFLAAMKLDGAVAIPGEGEMESEQLLSNVEQFASVQSGTISVNSVSISIDVTTDSLTDVLDRITASGAEVTASFDSTTQSVSLRSDNPDSQLILDSGSTDFFSALEIADGAYNPSNDTIQIQGIDLVHDPDLVHDYVNTDTSESSNQEAEATAVNATDAKMLGTFVNIIAGSMNALFSDTSVKSPVSARTEGIQNSIRSAVSASFGSEGPQYDTDFGIRFDFEDTERGVFNFSEADQHRFETALSTPEDGDAVRDALFGNDSRGLFDQLHGALTAAIPVQVGNATGLFLDIVV